MFITSDIIWFYLLDAGFYGRPWTMEQRTELFQREQTWGLNTYLYAPKDDYKHRMYWRDLYSAQEAEQLIVLISAAKRHNVEFIYAISPGLDITFSNPKEVAALKRKLDQVKEFGCRSFSLLFDDIETEMCPADKQTFSSFAHAQVAITNEVYQHLGEPETFLFCPTDYCAAFCTPSVPQSSYLHTVGEKLLPGIDILWTGELTVSVLIRLGPPSPGDEEEDPCYSPQKALTLALTDWLQEFLSTDQPGGKLEVTSSMISKGSNGKFMCRLKKEASDEEPMQTDMGESSYVPGPDENPLYTAEPLTLDDLKLLSDLFYLPYEHGPTARTMLRELDWLKNHSQAATSETDKSAEWCSRAQRFDDMCDAVVQMFNRLSNAPNRRILYDLYNYICDIKSGVGLARAYVKTLGGQGQPAAQLMNDDPEPWGFRGGLSGEFQRMLPGHGNRDLFKHPPMTTVYCIRPYCPEDKVEVQRVFTEMQRTGEGRAPRTAQPPLICDSLSAGDISPSPQCALVMEDDAGICGYALALTDATPAAAKTQVIKKLISEEFPSLVTSQVLPRVTDPSPAKRMIGWLLSSIKSSGSRGVFCELRQGDRRMLDFYSKLGSFKTIQVSGLPQDIVAMGRTL
uniref:GH84 domain-containing protein n=1 Tax=Anabas testudineus TaxID=64144 RepID=A0A7N6FFZ2_ANATE